MLLLIVAATVIGFSFGVMYSTHQWKKVVKEQKDAIASYQKVVSMYTHMENESKK